MNRKSGFTLLELLTVIAIIGILASIVIQTTNSAKVKARVARAQKIMEGIVPVLNICSLDEQSIRDPNVVDMICGAVGTTPGTYPSWPTMSGTGGGWAYQEKLPTDGDAGGSSPCNAGGAGGAHPPGCYCAIKYQSPYEICARGDSTSSSQKVGILCAITGCQTFTYDI